MISLRYRNDSSGFSLIELLVAMVIGLVTVVVVAQLMSFSEGERRAATTGSDAMVNGSLALYAIEREALSAGYGLTTVTTALGCDVKAKRSDGTVVTFPILAPVIITDGGVNGAPDSLRFLASSKTGVIPPTRLTVNHADTDTAFLVESTVGMQTGAGVGGGDLMMAVPASPSATKWCSVFSVSGIGAGGTCTAAGAGVNQVNHESNAQCGVWNPPVAQSVFPLGANGYVKSDYLINLGQMLDHTYSIFTNNSTSNLRLTPFDATTGLAGAPSDLFPQIVQLQAVYGKNTNLATDCVVDTWDSVAPTTPTGWQQIQALRVALVARSQIAEKTTVTLAEADVGAGEKCNTATPNAALVCWRPNPGNAATGVEIKLNIGNANPDWQRYRYRVFETTIPLRNMIWLQKTGNSTCGP